MNAKIITLSQAMNYDNIDIALFNNPQTIQYLTGYESDPHERILALLLFKDSSPLLFTPALEKEDAQKAVSEIEVFSYLDTENPWEVIRKKVESHQVPVKTWAIEKNHLTVARKEALESAFPDSLFSHDFSGLLENLRLQKEEHELLLMKEAGRFADEAIKIGARFLKEGITEQEVVAHIEYELKKKGISSMSFDTMVLFGPNAASPHGIPGSTTLEKNQFVLFDLGVMYQGYASDITRTLFFGDEPSEIQQEVYQLVLEAHDQAMQQAKLGMRAEELDHVARSIIDQAGYGTYFNHRLGHGLGQDVHEYPSLMAGNEMALQENMCFSIEPGIYILNQVGVRIEDCGYLDEAGFHSFTFFPTHLHAYKDFMNGN